MWLNGLVVCMCTSLFIKGLLRLAPVLLNLNTNENWGLD